MRVRHGVRREVQRKEFPMIERASGGQSGEVLDLPIEVDDAVILLLGGLHLATSGGVEGITKLEKLVFLLERESLVGRCLTENPEFSSHTFGPFSEKVYRAVDTLVAAELVLDSAKASDTNEDSWEMEQIIGIDEARYLTRTFTLSERGKLYYNALLLALPTEISDQLAEFKRRFATLPLRQLIRYIYLKYPVFTVNL